MEDDSFSTPITDLLTPVKHVHFEDKITECDPVPEPESNPQQTGVLSCEDLENNGEFSMFKRKVTIYELISVFLVLFIMNTSIVKDMLVFSLPKLFSNKSKYTFYGSMFVSFFGALVFYIIKKTMVETF